MAAVMQTSTSSKYEILREVVKDYPGILSATEPLLRELDSDSGNWGFIVKEMRTYALKNFYLHDHNEKGTDVMRTVIDVFLAAVDNPDIQVRQAAVEGLIFYIEKILIDGGNGLDKYEPIFQHTFIRLNQLPEEHFFLLVTNPHQLRRLGQIFLGKMPQDFNIKVFNDLLRRYLSAAYEYWLGEEDPLRSLRQLTRSFDEEVRKKLEELFYPLSHAHLKELVRHLGSLKKSTDPHQLLRELIKLPGYMQIVKFYEDLAETACRYG